MIRLIVAVQFVLATLAVRLRGERGQSSVEYLGIVAVAAALVVILVVAAAGWGGEISEAISAKISEIATAGGGGGG